MHIEHILMKGPSGPTVQVRYSNLVSD